jgi:hypothetical protein
MVLDGFGDDGRRGWPTKVLAVQPHSTGIADDYSPKVIGVGLDVWL